MKLDAFDRQFAVSQTHDQAVRRFGRDFQRSGQRFAFDDQRMIPSGVEIAFDACEQRPTVVFDDDRFAVNRFRPADYFAAEMLTDSLVAETNTEDRKPRTELFYDLKRYPCTIGCSGPGRDQYFLRFQLVFDLIDRYLVIAEYLHLGTEFAQVLDQVVRERIVIIHYKQHFFCCKTAVAKRSYLLIAPNKPIIFEVTAGGRMKLTKLTCSLILAALFTPLGFGQTPPAKKPTDDPAALKKEAVAFLRETMADVNNLRTLENRISFSAELAGLMWFHDEKEARSLYINTFGNFKELLIQYDQQMNAFGEPDGEDDQPYSYRGGLFGDLSDKSRLSRRFQIALQVRQQISMSLAEHDPELAFQFYFESTQAVSNPAFRKQMESRDEYFEGQLMAEVAKTNAAKASQFAKTAIEKGVNHQHLELLRKVHEKDPEKGAELAQAILSKIKSDSANPEKFWIMSSFLSTAGASLESSQKEGGKKPMLTSAELKDLADVLALAVLREDGDSGMGLQYVSEIEKYNPSRGAQIRTKFRGAGRGTSANAIAIAANSAASAANSAADANYNGSNSNSRAERERIERERAEKDLAENVGKLANNQLPKEEREKIISQVRKILMSTPGKDKKIVGLSGLAAVVAKAGDKELAAEIMKEAQTLVSPQPKNIQDFILTWMLASGYAEADPDKAFPLLEETIMRANDTLAAFIKVGEFIDVAGEMIDEGEVQVGAFGGQMVRGLTSELGMADATLRTLAKADFGKTKNLASRFDRSEVRILAKMMILRAVLEDGKKKETDGEMTLTVDK